MVSRLDLGTTSIPPTVVYGCKLLGGESAGFFWQLPQFHIDIDHWTPSSSSSILSNTKEINKTTTGIRYANISAKK